MTTINELKIKELELKGQGFDIYREIEVHEVRLGQLKTEQLRIISELKSVYELAKIVTLAKIPEDSSQQDSEQNSFTKNIVSAEKIIRTDKTKHTISN